MSSSSLFSTSSLSSSSSSSSFSSPSFSSSAMAASRQRRKRRDAISRAAESDWDASPTTAAVGPHDTASIPPPWHTDELICPLAPSSAPLPPSTFLSLAPPTDEDVGDLQAMLARFTFPSPPPTSRKHRRSGESVDHSSADVNATIPGATTGTNSENGNGPVRRAPCAHCACGRTSV